MVHGGRDRGHFPLDAFLGPCRWMAEPAVYGECGLENGVSRQVRVDLDEDHQDPAEEGRWQALRDPITVRSPADLSEREPSAVRKERSVGVRVHERPAAVHATGPRIERPRAAQL